MLRDVAIRSNKNVVQKEKRKKLKYKSLCIEITTNVEPEMYDYTNWSHRNRNKSFKEKLFDLTYID